MNYRKLIHVGGATAAGKTTLIELLLRRDLGIVCAVRCECDNNVKTLRETSPKKDAELKRYRLAGACDVARFRMPPSGIEWDDIWSTGFFNSYSEAVLLEGYFPFEAVDCRVFIARPVEGPLLVRITRDRAAERSAEINRLETILSEPSRANTFFADMFGPPIAEMLNNKENTIDQLRLKTLADLEKARSAPPPPPTKHWAISEAYRGIEAAQVVIFNVMSQKEQDAAKALLKDINRLRADKDVFHDIFAHRGHRIPITAIQADLRDGKDAGTKKVLSRIGRSLSTGPS